MPFQIQTRHALEFFGAINLEDFTLLKALAADLDSTGPVIPSNGRPVTRVELVEACIGLPLSFNEKTELEGGRTLLTNTSFVKKHLGFLNNLSADLKKAVCGVRNLGAFLKSIRGGLDDTCFATVLSEATTEQDKNTFLRKDHPTLVLECILSQSDVQQKIAALKAKFQGWVRDRKLCNNEEFVKTNLPHIIARFKDVIFSKCRNLNIDIDILSDLNKDTNPRAGYPQYWIDQTDQNILAYLADVSLTVSSPGNSMLQSQTVWGEKFSSGVRAPQKSVHIELESGHYQAMLTRDDRKKQKVNVRGDGYCGYYAFSLGLMAVEYPAYTLQSVSSSSHDHFRMPAPARVTRRRLVTNSSPVVGSYGMSAPSETKEGSGAVCSETTASARVRFFNPEAVQAYNAGLKADKALKKAIKNSIELLKPSLLEKYLFDISGCANSEDFNENTLKLKLERMNLVDLEKYLDTNDKVSVVFSGQPETKTKIESAIQAAIGCKKSESQVSPS